MKAQCELHSRLQRATEGAGLTLSAPHTSWYHTPEQKEEASAAIAQLQAQGRKVGTTLDPAGLWVDAEEYHQKYHEKILARQSANL